MLPLRGPYIPARRAQQLAASHITGTKLVHGGRKGLFPNLDTYVVLSVVTAPLIGLP